MQKYSLKRISLHELNFPIQVSTRREGSKPIDEPEQVDRQTTGSKNFSGQTYRLQ